MLPPATPSPGPGFSVRFAMLLQPSDVGRRVVVRHRLPAAESTGAGGPSPSMTDVVGELVSWQDGTLEVRDRHGRTALIAVADVVAGKPVPPSPPRAARAPRPPA